jgi:DNA polymerase-3 subunit delta'
MSFAAPEALRLLLQAHAQDRLAHAYLITGPEGSGKRQLAAELCGRILGCPPETALSHVDVHAIAPESKSRRLLIEQVRELEQKVRMRSMSGGKKFAIIHDADRLMPQAANAFLKTLEEPPAETHILLISAHPSQLLETILSRCVEVPVRLTNVAARTASQAALIELLNRFFTTKKPELSSGLWLAQQVYALLGHTKETVQDLLEAEAKAEEKLYKQTADPKWLAQRDEIYSARTEAAYLLERSRLLEMLESFWTDVLLVQREQPARHLIECARHAATIAAALSPADALNRVQSITRLREHLGMSGVNEPLALEYGILEAFAPALAS